jgi:predicted pyridoxine 5'-phosphate oxidase superfamily flavin-nucleotide-binding protein
VRETLRSTHECLSFVDVFVQKGFKLIGNAREVQANDAAFTDWAEPLLAMVGQRFTIQSVLVIQVQSVAAIVAPSYRFYPHDTTEASQVASAMRAYNVQAVEKDKP